MAYPIKAIPTLYGEEARRSKKWQTKQSANMIIPHGTHAMGYHYY